MVTYTNIIIINGIEYTNVVTAENYKAVLLRHKQQKRNSKFTFRCRLTKL